MITPKELKQKRLERYDEVAKSIESSIEYRNHNGHNTYEYVSRSLELLKYVDDILIAAGYDTIITASLTPPYTDYRLFVRWN